MVFTITICVSIKPLDSASNNNEDLKKHESKLIYNKNQLHMNNIIVTYKKNSYKIEHYFYKYNPN